MLEQMLADADKIIQNEFGLSVTKNLELYSKSEWQSIVKKDSKEDGITTIGLYNRQTGRARVNRDEPRYIATVFHEVYGHGLYYQRSLAPEWRVLDDKKADSEGFACWIQAYLCNKFGFRSMWNQSHAAHPELYQDAYNAYKRFEKDETAFGVMAALGFPVEVTPAKLEAYCARHSPYLVLQDGEASVRDGTRLVMVTDNGTRKWRNNWLTVQELSRQDCTRLVAEKDPRMQRALHTTPIVGSELQMKLLTSLTNRKG